MSSMDASGFTPMSASVEDLRRIEERMAAAEQRLDELDERVVGSTAWIVSQARTVTLMTPNEGMGLLRWALGKYDARRGEQAGHDTLSRIQGAVLDG